MGEINYLVLQVQGKSISPSLSFFFSQPPSPWTSLTELLILLNFQRFIFISSHHEYSNTDQFASSPIGPRHSIGYGTVRALYNSISSLSIVYI